MARELLSDVLCVRIEARRTLLREGHTQIAFLEEKAEARGRAEEMMVWKEMMVSNITL